MDTVLINDPMLFYLYPSNRLFGHSFIRLFGCSFIRLYGYAYQIFRLFVFVYSVIRVRLFVSAVQIGVVLTVDKQNAIVYKTVRSWQAYTRTI